MRPPIGTLLVIAALTCCLLAGEARATTYSWYGIGNSDNWTDANNWIPDNANYPGYQPSTGRNDVAVFSYPVPQGYNAIVNTSINIASVQYVTAGFTLWTVSSLTVTNGISATYDTAPNLVNDGDLYFGGTATVKTLTSSGSFRSIYGWTTPATLNVVGVSSGNYTNTLLDGLSSLSLTIGDGTHAASLSLAPSFIPAYTGPTLVAANATLIGAGANAFSTSSAHTITGTLRLTAGSSAIGPLSGTGPIDLQGTSALVLSSGTYDGVIGGSGALGKSGPGTFTLNTANTYTGGTTVSGGVLTIAGAGTFGATTGAVAVNTGGTLDLAGFSRSAGAVTIAGGTLQNGTLTGTSYAAQSGTVSAALAGSGVELTKTTAGTLTLSGANTYTGATTVSAGALLVNGSLGNSAVFVAAGATLGGSGSIAGTVTLGSGGIGGGGGMISPGQSPGTLTTGDEFWFRGAEYTWQLNDASDAPGAKGVSYDWVNINGSLTVTATLGTPLVLFVTSLTAGNAPGTTPNFVDGQTYQWTIATASGGIIGFNPDNVFIDSTAFANDPHAADAGRMTIAQAGNSLILSYAIPVPEPAVMALLSLGGLAIGVARLRKRA